MADNARLVKIAKTYLQKGRWKLLLDLPTNEEVQFIYSKAVMWLKKKSEKEGTPPGYVDQNKDHLAVIRIPGIPLSEYPAHRRAFQHAFDSALEAMMEQREKDGSVKNKLKKQELSINNPAFGIIIPIMIVPPDQQGLPDAEKKVRLAVIVHEEVQKILSAALEERGR